MDYKNLIESASLLKQPNSEACREISEKREMLANAINGLFKQRTDLTHMIGAGNLEMMMDNHRNHIRFMASLFGDYHPEVLVETVLWVFRAYRSHGFQLTYWPAQLDTWVEVFKKELSPGCFHEVYPFYNWMIINNPAFAKLSDKVLHEDSTFQLGSHH